MSTKFQRQRSHPEHETKLNRSKSVSSLVLEEKVPHDRKDGITDLSLQEAIDKKRRQKMKEEKKKNLYNKLKGVHIAADSMLVSSSGFENYRGVVNLSLLLLVLSNFRVALNNILKYGVLVDPNIIFLFLERPNSWPSLTLVLCSNIFIQICLYLEKQLEKGKINEWLGSKLHILNITFVIVTPIYVVFKFDPSPLFATLALMWYTCLTLKLVSYIEVNWWCREERVVKRMKDSDLKPIGPVVYPNNLNQKDLYYFMAVPTFCYELNFPRTKKLRKRFLIRRVAEALFLTGLIIALAQQWIVPTVKNSLHSFEELDLARFLERIMKLAIPNHLLWLMGFYAFFHSGLNISAELLCFADRTFYKDWWNSPNVAIFWQNWNIPIHRWAKRHVYEPMLRNNYSNSQAGLFVFFISAFFHEFIVSIPLQMFRPYAFLSMVMQFPLVLLTARLRKPWGNIFMWLSLIIGQPMAIMMYYHDYLVEHNIQLK